jgi:hypothetical protein
MPLASTSSSAITYNMDIRGLVSRINDFIEELNKSVSSNIHFMNTFDQARLMSYITAVRTYHSWIVAQPQLDLPETSPRAYTLDPNPDIVPMENQDVRELVNMFEITRDELIGSQSGRMGAGLLSFDSGRLLAVLAKAESFLVDYVQPTSPLDVPESSPGYAMTPAGKVGV